MSVTYLPLLAPDQYHALDDAGRNTDTAAVLIAARTLHVDHEPLTEQQRWNVTRILGRDARAVLDKIGDVLAAAHRFACCTDSGDVAELIDGSVGPDWAGVAEREAADFRAEAHRMAEEAVALRADARWIAEGAVQR